MVKKIPIIMAALVFGVAFASFYIGRSSVNPTASTAAQTITQTTTLGVLWQGLGTKINVTSTSLICTILPNDQQNPTWTKILAYVINNPLLGAMVQMTVIQLPVYVCH